MPEKAEGKESRSYNMAYNVEEVEKAGKTTSKVRVTLGAG
jgi:hypothetical protein